MSKKDYIAIADAIRKAHSEVCPDGNACIDSKCQDIHEAINMTAGHIADVFGNDNPQFSRITFMGYVKGINGPNKPKGKRG